MGSAFGKQMDENLKKQQQFMLESQRLQLERQLQMQNIMREKQMALQVANSRDLFLWVGGTTIIILYLFDMGYGTKLKRMRGTAESLLTNQPSLFGLPLGPIRIEDIERRRNLEAAEDQLKPNDLFL